MNKATLSHCNTGQDLYSPSEITCIIVVVVTDITSTWFLYPFLLTKRSKNF